MERQEYPALLTNLEPEQAVDLLNGRVATINQVHNAIADWLQDRRKVEEQYATSLRKLVRRVREDEANGLGVFQMPWQRIVSSMENMAQSHETLAASIQTDVETPLRKYATNNREMQSMGNISGNLSSIAKDLSNAQKKAQKEEAKGSTKADGARSNLDDAQSQWTSQAPFVFEQLQALDEARCNHLRDVLTQFQTHELDQVERVRASAESCLNALLNVETADEIRTFALRAKGQPGTTAARRESMVGSSRAPGMAVPPTPPPPRHASVEHRNSSVSGQDTLAPLPEPPKEKKLSGLKRLGTVMGRRKSAMPPPVPSEKKKEKTRSFVPFRRQESSRSFQDLESSGHDLTPQRSTDDRASSRHDSERPPQTQESRLSDAQPPPALNGVAQHSELDASPSIAVQSAPPMQPLIPEQREVARSDTLSPESAARSPDRRSMQPDPFAQAMDTSASPGEESARNFEIKDQPIPEDTTAAQRAMDNMANQLRMQAQSSGLNRVQGSMRGRRDVRNTMFISSPAQQQQELPSAFPATPDLAPPSTPASALTALTGGTASTSATSTSGGASDVATPFKRSLGTGTIPEDASYITSDSQSVHSAHSTVGMAHHAEMTQPGLNASIIETVNTWLGDSGVTRSFVVGEVALAYNRSGTSAHAENEVLRLQNFHQLEKCAQNPQFVNPQTSSTGGAQQEPGTYSIALPSISRSIPSVAFKYQLHMAEADLAAYSPLLVTQAWQIVDGQASVILMYSLNPSFAPLSDPGTSPNPRPKELTLKNVALTVSLDTKDGAKAVSAQMMPVQNAHFKRRTSAVVWRFSELRITPNQERLLVRFMVENNGTAKRGGVDIKFEAQNTLASALGVERLVPAEAVTSAADPFADEDEARKSAEGQTGQRWEDVQSRKVLVAGKYSVT